ncbi:MAG: hypothetical protein CVU69_06410 [Deltaproteobacteria bacterium HGW-Deltaproteobacteria-4]|nr:MAG: hypothetical protein CVU69_06410 [Deltaproteobacteria bacterium HGW-Deltaproteobacteria-4]
MRNFIVLMFILTCALCPNLYAAPALQRFEEIAQPDGTIIKVRQQGDEFQHWTETKSGYTILHNPKTKYWDYAEPDANGRLKASGYRAMPQGFVPSHISPRLKPPRNKALELYRQKSLNKTYQERQKGKSLSFPAALAPSVQLAAVGDWTPIPIAGERKLLLVRINFSDRNLVTTPAQWESTVFSPTNKSVTRYYADNSFSSLRVSPATHSQPGNPAGILTVSIAAPHPYPGGDRDPNESYATEPGILNLALAQAATFVDFSSFDADHNGTLEQSELSLYFIYAGYEASDSSDKFPSVWAHAWGGPGVTAAGLHVTDWALNGELNSAGRQQTMGIIAHELGHALCGLPDLYDTSYTNAGMGIFSLMAAGSWGADSSEDAGATPTALDLWSRQYLGWATAAEPGPVTTITIHPSLSAPDSGYILQTPVSESEYYLVENRRPAGWDLGAKYALGANWQGGLLLTHIDTTAGTAGSNDINNFTATGGRQGVSPVQASTAICDMFLADCWGSAPALFYAGNNSAWRPLDAPNSNFYDGTPTDFSLTGISLPGTAMTGDWSTTPVPLLPVIDDFESGDFSRLPWLSNGDSSWEVTDSGYHSVYAAGAPTIADSQSATLQTTVSTEIPGYVSFRYAVDSEFAYDFLIFFIDGVEKGRWSGSTNWSRAAYTLETGTHTLTWTYKKDSSEFSGLDTAWIDDLSFPARYELNVLLTGNGNVTPDVGTLVWTGSTGSATYDNGTVVSLTAHADPNSIFNDWEGACSGSGTCEVTMDAAKNVSAIFAASPAPTVTTGAASAISTSGATLNANVNANNSDSVVSFEYGTDTGYGTTIAPSPETASGTTDTAVSVTLTGLNPGETYHFRVVSTNMSGTTYGDDSNFTVLKLDQSLTAITFLPAALAVNGTTTASAAATSGLAVTLTSTTTDTCTISGSTVTGLSAGICTIVANQVGDSNYNAATPISQNITVGKANQSLAEITFTHPILPLNGFTTASTTASSGLDVTWFSFTPTVCTVANDNTINGIAPGTCTITANQIGDTNYNAAPPISQDIPVVKVYVYDGYETTAADALFALQMAIGKRAVDMSADLAPLINRIPAPDGKVTAADALVILRKAVGLW